MNFLNWHDETNTQRTELVFEGRNKAYGGYVLRNEYNTRTTKAFIISVLVVVFLFVTPLIISYISNFRSSSDVKLNNNEVTLSDVPPIDKIAPPPPAEPPPPVQKTIKFTPPVVVQDDKAEEPPPTQEEVKETQVSTETHEGDKNIVDLPPDPVVDPDAGKVFTIVEEMPTFPGGEDALMRYLGDKIKYPAIARENNIQGKVFVNFVVNKDGKVTDAKILRGIGGGCDEEALRVVRSLPDWKPGRQNGRYVSVSFNVPVNFSLK